ncbi:MAG: hypothetical protein A3J97_07625 [Spirochaetes bacterium RIFOXYC1_FULL_54_7]|nr:MAG: hypothetical protein A3J97_07625 [Spirochaetes bacterium RIFOXYC1_FULL_54_7]
MLRTGPEGLPGIEAQIVAGKKEVISVDSHPANGRVAVVLTAYPLVGKDHFLAVRYPFHGSGHPCLG